MGKHRDLEVDTRSGFGWVENGMRWGRVWMPCLIFVVGIIFCRAQTEIPRASFQGKVLDPSGSTISGARVIATQSVTQTVLSTVSAEDGRFFLMLEPATYTLKISAAGFEELSREVNLQNEFQLQEIVLELARHHDAIQVTETTAAPLDMIRTATKTLTPVQDIPQSITVVTKELIRDQSMQSIGDVVRFVPGVTAIQGENNRDQVVIRGNSSSADFYLNGVRDDVQYYRDLYNLERVEVLKGPNALIFGRGGAGGVINRVPKEPGFSLQREVTLNLGSYGSRRIAADFEQPWSHRAGVRLNGMYENSNSFRNFVGLERYGISPALAINAGQRTTVKIGYEHIHDSRVADRGIPSFHGRPSAAGVSTFFGNPEESFVNARVNLGAVTIERQAGQLTLRNHSLFGGYDRKYQNFVPGAVNADAAQAALSVYNNATERRNLFNQTDATLSGSTGPVRHTLLAGVELGRQRTDNFRNTGFFNNTSTSITVPFASPTISTPVIFRQSATDADNHLSANVAATYFQDQIALSRYLQVTAGVRFDYFDLRFHNNRTGETLRRIDRMVSPRAGIVVKPIVPLSLYASYSVSNLPSSGDQFSSLTTVTQSLKPERFSNYEAGAKMDLARKLSLTTAVYRLDRINTRATDPNDPTRIVQTGSQRTKGFELGLSGNMNSAWQIVGGYAYQYAAVTRATTAAPVGALVAQVPAHTFSLWNHYRFHSRWSVAIGLLHRTDMFAAIDNRVTLPGYTRADAAVFYSLTERMRLQANIENVLDKTYFLNADSNDNISPGPPRAIRVGMTARF